MTTNATGPDGPTAYERFQHLYDAAYIREDVDRMSTMDDAWDAAIEECERAHDHGRYTDDMVAAHAMKLLAKGGIQ